MPVVASQIHTGQPLFKGQFLGVTWTFAIGCIRKLCNVIWCLLNTLHKIEIGWANNNLVHPPLLPYPVNPMVKKIILICLVGLLGVVGFAGPTGADASSSTTVLIAQMETPAPTVPTEQSRPEKQPETPPAAEQTTSKQTATDRQPSVEKRSDAKPFNPYDMKALKQFDAGDHRAN